MLIQKGKYLKAQKLLGTMGLGEVLDPDLDARQKLALADTYFFHGGSLNVIEAQSRYQQFLNFYPTHGLAGYAQYQLGECLLLQSEAPYNDQDFTKRAIDEFRKVVDIDPRSPYAWAALAKVRQAEDKLAEHEWLVAQFYAKGKHWKAVIGRLQNLLESYPAYSGKEKVFYHLGRALIQNDNLIEGQIYLEKLLVDYPEGSYSEQARGLLERTQPTSAS
jgi:outer membrane protein assembly factor BamD